MSTKDIFLLHAEICKALAHPLRLEVIEILQKGELCFSDILEITGGLKSNLSQHISILTKVGILKMKRDGKCNYYSLASKKIAIASELMKEVVVDNLQQQSTLLQNINR